MAFTPSQVIQIKKDIPAWATPDVSQSPYGTYGTGTQITVVAQTGNVVKVRATVKPRSSK